MNFKKVMATGVSTVCALSACLCTGFAANSGELPGIATSAYTDSYQTADGQVIRTNSGAPKATDECTIAVSGIESGCKVYAIHILEGVYNEYGLVGYDQTAFTKSWILSDGTSCEIKGASEGTVSNSVDGKPIVSYDRDLYEQTESGAWKVKANYTKDGTDSTAEFDLFTAFEDGKVGVLDITNLAKYVYQHGASNVLEAGKAYVHSLEYNTETYDEVILLTEDESKRVSSTDTNISAAENNTDTTTYFTTEAKAGTYLIIVESENAEYVYNPMIVSNDYTDANYASTLGADEGNGSLDVSGDIDDDSSKSGSQGTQNTIEHEGSQNTMADDTGNECTISYVQGHAYAKKTSVPFDKAITLVTTTHDNTYDASTDYSAIDGLGDGEDRTYDETNTYDSKLESALGAGGDTLDEGTSTADAVSVPSTSVNHAIVGEDGSVQAITTTTGTSTNSEGDEVTVTYVSRGTTTSTSDNHIDESHFFEEENSVDAEDVAVGDTVTFEIKTIIPDYSEAFNTSSVQDITFKITDTQAQGLTAPITTDGTISTTDEEVKNAVVAYTYIVNSEGVREETAIDPSEYDVVLNGDNSFTLTFNNDEYLMTHRRENIVIRYKSQVTDKAYSACVANPNTAELEFTTTPNGHTEGSGTEDTGSGGSTGKREDTVNLYTFTLEDELLKIGEDSAIAIEGTNGEEDTTSTVVTGEAVSGATFVLTKTMDRDGNDVTDKGYVYQYTTDEDGHVKFVGLDEGVYKLQETDAAAGKFLSDTQYTVWIKAEYEGVDEWGDTELLKDYTVTIATEKGEVLATNTYTAEYSEDGEYTGQKNTIEPLGIVNTHLSKLPSTGGTGEKVFSALGVALLMGGAYFIFTTDKKKKEEAAA